MRSRAIATLLLACLLLAEPVRAQDAWSDLSNAANQAMGQKRWTEAEQLFLLAVQEAEREGPSSQHVIPSLQGLGMLYLIQKKYAQAEQPLQRATALAEQAFGSDDPRLWDPLHLLASAYIGQKKWPEAEALYRRCIAIFEKHPESNRVYLPTLLEGLALMLKSQGRYEEAEAILRRAAELPAAPHAQNVLRARELIRISDQQRARKEKEKAEESIRQALELLQDADATDLSVHGSLRLIAQYYASTSRNSEAEALYLRLLSGQEKSPEPARSGRTSTMQALGELYLREKRLDEAEQMFRRALATVGELGESSSFVTAGLVTRLANIAEARGRYAEAEEILRKELEREEREGKLDSPGWPGYPFALLKLARFYTTMNRYEEAEALFRQILARQEENLGPDDRRLELALTEYARLLRKMHRTAEAAALEERAKRLRQKPPG